MARSTNASTATIYSAIYSDTLKTATCLMRAEREAWLLHVESSTNRLLDFAAGLAAGSLPPWRRNDAKNPDVNT